MRLVFEVSRSFPIFDKEDFTMQLISQKACMFQLSFSKVKSLPRLTTLQDLLLDKDSFLIFGAQDYHELFKGRDYIPRGATGGSRLLAFPLWPKTFGRTSPFFLSSRANHNYIKLHLAYKKL